MMFNDITTNRLIEGQEVAEASCGCVAVFQERPETMRDGKPYKPPAFLISFDRRCPNMTNEKDAGVIAEHLNANTDEEW